MSNVDFVFLLPFAILIFITLLNILWIIFTLYFNVIYTLLITLAIIYSNIHNIILNKHIFIIKHENYFMKNIA